LEGEIALILTVDFWRLFTRGFITAAATGTAAAAVAS